MNKQTERHPALSAHPIKLIHPVSKLFFIICLLFFIISDEAAALIRHEFLGEITVTVEGAKRTRHRYVESLVEKCLEKGAYKKWEEVEAEALGQCLRNSRIFSKVEITINRPDINAAISERWTLIPLPFFYSSDDKRAGGIFLYETNFFGYGKTAGAGGSISTEGNTFSVMFSDPSVNFTDYTLAFAAYKSQTELNAYHGDDIIEGYKKREVGVSLSPGYRITPKLKFTARLTYSDSKYEQLESYDIPDDYSSAGAGMTVSYDNADYKLFYNEGASGKIIVTGQVHRSDDNRNAHQATGKFEWGTLFREHALQTCVHGAILSRGGAGDVMMYGRGKGFRGIQPAGLWTRRILALSLDYQVPVLKSGHGTFTVAPYADYGMYKPLSAEAGNHYTSYGIGAYYFINLVNLPGVGILAGINDEFMGPFFDVQIGMGF